MTKTLGKFFASSNSSRIKQDISDRAAILGELIQKLGGNKIEKGDKIYNSTSDIHKVLSSTSHNGKTMKKNSDIFLMKFLLTIQVTQVLEKKNQNANCFS